MMEFKEITEKFRDDLPDLMEFTVRTMMEHQCSMDMAASLYAAYYAVGFKVYENDDYIVMKFPEAETGVVRLSIQNVDKSAKHDWRDFQEIKNTLVGPENEAVELYPAESRKNDLGNAFHIFALTDPTARFRLGSPERRVSNTPPEGYEQRPLPASDPESGEA